MDKLPICKLCGSEPIQYERIDAVICSGRLCAMSMTEVTAEEWTLLMGEDRDAVRYRWLCAEIENGAVSGVSGALVELFDETMYDNGEELSAAIDAAMAKEQGDE